MCATARKRGRSNPPIAVASEVRGSAAEMIHPRARRSVCSFMPNAKHDASALTSLKVPASMTLSTSSPLSCMKNSSPTAAPLMLSREDRLTALYVVVSSCVWTADNHRFQLAARPKQKLVRHGRFEARPVPFEPRCKVRLAELSTRHRRAQPPACKHSTNLSASLVPLNHPGVWSTWLCFSGCCQRQA